MSRTGTRRSVDSSASIDPGRLARADRREALLDAAAQLVAAGTVLTASMEAVADRAGVSRALVYKHFANRADLLAALYHREAELLHAQIAEQVHSAGTVVEMYRALVRAAITAARDRHAVFAALLAAGALTRDERAERHRRDRRTVEVFTARAVDEFGLPEPAARAVTTLLLSAVHNVVTQWLHEPTDDHAAILERAYLALALGGLGHLTDPG